MIKRIHIENFKSIKNLDIEIPNFSILVGNNGAGKTNFLNAIKLVALLAGGRQIEEVLQYLGLILPTEVLHDRTNPTMKFTIELEVENRSITYAFSIEQELLSNDNISYKIVEESLANGDKGNPILKRVGSNIEINSPSIEDQSRKSFELVSNQLAISIVKEPQIVLVTQSYLSSIVVDTFEPSFLKRFGSVSKRAPRSERNLVEILYTLYNSNRPKYKEIEYEYKKLLLGLDEVQIKKYSEDLVGLAFKESGQNNIYSLLSASSGNIRTLGILAAVMVEPIAHAIFIDEIENSLHPKRIKSVIKLLDYIAEREINSIQTILTTHSPIVLNYVNPDQLIYIYKQNGETKASVINKEKSIYNTIQKAIKDGRGLGDLFESGALEIAYTKDSDF